MKDDSTKKKEKKPRGFWTMNESENIRKFFDKYAFDRNFDPLVADNWYTMPIEDVVREENVCLIMIIMIITIIL